MEEWWGEDDDAPSDEGECIPPSPPRSRPEASKISSSDDGDHYNNCSGTLANNINGIGSGALSTSDNVVQRIDDNHDVKNHRDRLRINDEGVDDDKMASHKYNARKMNTTELSTIRKSMILRGRQCREGQNSSSSAVSFSSSPLLEGRWSSPMLIEESNPDNMIPAAAARVARFEASLGGRTTPTQLDNDNSQYEHDKPPSCRNFHQRSRRRNQLEQQQRCLPTKQLTYSMTDQADTLHTIEDKESTNISSLHPSFKLISLNSNRRVRNSRSQKSRFVPTTQTVETDNYCPSSSGTSSSSSITARPSISRASVQSSISMTSCGKCEYVSSATSVGSEISEHDVDMFETYRQQHRLSQAGANSLQQQQQQQQRPSPVVLNKFMSAVNSNKKTSECNSVPIQQTGKSQQQQPQRQHQKYTRLSLAESNNFMTAGHEGPSSKVSIRATIHKHESSSTLPLLMNDVSANAVSRNNPLSSTPSDRIISQSSTSHSTTSTVSRINQILNELNVDRNAAPWRPTQAQLRWAQFHREARALETRGRIDRLMNFPSSMSDVYGAHSSDADDSSDDDDDDDGNDATLMYSRSKRIAVSTGRRVMLRVSARAYDERKKKQLSFSVPMTVSIEDAERRGRFDEARMILAASPTLHHRYQPRVIAESAERKRRFEAYKLEAMLRAEHANEGDDTVGVLDRWLKAGGKRWTRDPLVASAASIDGRQYSDLQRTPTISLKQMNELSDQTTRWLTNPRNIRHFCRVGENSSLSNTLGHIIETATNPQEAFFADKMSDIQSVVSGMREAKVDQRHASVGISTLRLLFSGVKSASVGPLHNGSSRLKTNSRTPQPIHCNHESHAHNNIPSQVTLTEEREVGVSIKSKNQAKISKLFDSGLFGKVTARDGVSTSVQDIDALNNTRKTDASSRNHFSHTAITNYVQSLFTDQEESTTIGTDDVQSKVADLDTSEIDDVEFEYKRKESSGNQFSQADVTNILKSLYTDDIDPTIIDTDGAETYVPDVTGADYAEKIRSMLMSPQLITKRYHQALRAIESRNWKQLSYLICANPWLMEMKDVRNDQCLVHTLSLFGGGLNDSADIALPIQMVQSIIDYESNVVYKIDIEGNLPLHMAAASGNMIMIEELGRVFPGAASVQNHDGLLPLHLAVQSCDIFTTCLQAIESLLIMFPGAVGVKDNDGNTPLHTAATLLRGDIASTVIHLLLMAVDSVKEENVPSLDKSRSFDSLPETLIMMATDTPEQVSSNNSRAISWNNNAGETPLTAAIKAKAGLQVVEALINGNYENLAALKRNCDSLNALHLALDMNNGFYDADVVIFILKTSPLIVTIPDGEGNLPIQLASRNSLQSDIILAITIIDLPIDLEVKECAILRDGFGASWSYLICESNDMHVGVVRQILELCSQPQKEALSLAIARGKRKTVTECATPLCKDELRKSILFLGRFVILGNQRTHVYSWYAQKFDAIDSYSDEKVSLVCYEDAKSYTKDRELLQRIANDTELFEELNFHTVGGAMYISAKKTPTSLASVIEEMSHERRIKHFRTSRSILRGIAKSLSKLHGQGIIHGSLDIQNVGKFGKCWKLMDLPGSVAVNELFTACRVGLHSPPEAFITARCKINHERNIASIAPTLAADPTVDVWAFGKLMYEVLVGESLFKIFSVEGSYLKSSMCIHAWNGYHLKKISRKLISEGINSSGVNLISICLCPLLSERCKSMSDVLHHPFWSDKNVPRSSAVSLQYIPAPDLFTHFGNISEGLLDSVGI